VPLEIPSDFDVDFYRASNGDLSAFSEEQAVHHYKTHGIQEGRPPSPFALRENFLPLIAERGDILEIGPFTNPAVRGANIRYFDVLDRTALIERAKLHGYPTDNVPEIDFVSLGADLSVVDKVFDGVLSCHTIEHQPDLINHLLQVKRILRPGGHYFLIIPDKRYCFDYFIKESDLPEVLAAHYEERHVHTLRSVIEHRAFITHNDSYRHWRGDHGEITYISERTKVAVREWEQSSGTYIDVHAWQFTPATFSTLLSSLKDLNLSSFEVTRVFPTPLPRLEFCAILTRI
jgi:SAM-dependent methyltransferase